MQQDVELRLAVGAGPQQQPAWVGTYVIPAGVLPSATHLEIQLAFKGIMQEGQQAVWDNNHNRCTYVMQLLLHI